MSELGLFHHSTLAATTAALQERVACHGEALATTLTQSLTRFSDDHHGDFSRWQQALAALPDIGVLQRALDLCVTVTGAVSTPQHQALRDALGELKPWRKGPFALFDVHLDTEWRSDWKWQRLAPAFRRNPAPLLNARVLDVGCGNGYFGWQLLGGGAASVIGIDPTLLFCMQHLAINRYLQDDRNWVLPLRLEELPAIASDGCGFDGVLSMGVLYHRRDPQAHINELYRLVEPGGWLVLETLVVDQAESIYPANDGGRYARMRNVWCVPTEQTVANWLEDAGFETIELLDSSVTSVQEQRATEWMTFESLSATLDADDARYTVEGWPRPRRAMWLTRRPGV